MDHTAVASSLMAGDGFFSFEYHNAADSGSEHSACSCEPDDPGPDDGHIESFGHDAPGGGLVLI